MSDYDLSTNLGKWMYYLQDLESPDHFIEWNYYYAISSAIGRKLWLDDLHVFPNLYIIFVGPPAVGKSLPAEQATRMLKDLVEVQGDTVRNLVNISPDSITLEKLYARLSQATRPAILPDGKKYSHASMSFCLAEELAILFRDKSNDLVQFLTAGYNCGDIERDTKHNGHDVIKNSCINLLGCATPDWIQSNVSSGMIAQGFTSRVLFAYGEKPRKQTFKIIFTPDQLSKLAEVKAHIRKVASLAGQLKISKEADAWREDWVKTKNKAHNPDRRLEYYYGRKKIHLYKMAINLHFAEKLSMELTVDDFEKADKKLTMLEANMHKALASTGNNPINGIAEAIKTALRLRGPQSHKKILIDNFHLGDEEMIGKALNFLQTTGQLTSAIDGNRVVYSNAQEQ